MRCGPAAAVLLLRLSDPLFQAGALELVSGGPDRQVGGGIDGRQTWVKLASTTWKETSVKIALAVALCASVLAAQAQAVALRFSLVDESGEQVVWRLDNPSQPTSVNLLNPDDSNQGFALFEGVATTSSLSGTRSATIFFGNLNSPQLGVTASFGILRSGGVSSLVYGTSSDPVFSGSVASPQLALGVFNFPAIAMIPGVSAGRPSGTLTISAVPEPSTWLSMVAGFGLLGGALRLRRAAKAGPALAC
jgi:PEP-CTERM motif